MIKLQENELLAIKEVLKEYVENYHNDDVEDNLEVVCYLLNKDYEFSSIFRKH